MSFATMGWGHPMWAFQDYQILDYRKIIQNAQSRKEKINIHIQATNIN